MAPLIDRQPTTEATRIGFAVSNVDGLVQQLSAAGATIHQQQKTVPEADERSSWILTIIWLTLRKRAKAQRIERRA
jgi:hypothetical protein